MVREYAELKAPLAGVVTEKLAEPGTLASPGTPLLTLERAGGYRLDAAVEESKIASVRVGQAVRVSLESGESDGRVVEIMPSVDAASRSYTVKLAVAGPRPLGHVRQGRVSVGNPQSTRGAGGRGNGARTDAVGRYGGERHGARPPHYRRNTGRGLGGSALRTERRGKGVMPAPAALPGRRPRRGAAVTGAGPGGTVCAHRIESKLTPLIICAALLIGGFAVWKLPREEEPQIIVPMIDVFVQMPGASAHEVEERITRPMEKLLWEIPGVEYVYSTSSPRRLDRDRAVLRGAGRREEHRPVEPETLGECRPDPAGRLAAAGQAPVIDDVPILALTLSSQRYDDLVLRRIAAEVTDTVKQAPEVSA